MKMVKYVLTFVFLFVLFCSVCFGKTITVDDDGPADFSSIQAALADAETVNGDAIEVAPGTYYETINFLGKAVYLYSSDGPEVTIIDGTGHDHVVQCISDEDDNTILEGFTITGGNANGASFPGNSGGGMYNFASHPTVTNCIFSSNHANSDGGGIFNASSNPIVTNCIFISNTAGYYGGGMYNSYADPTVTNCIFIDNEAVTGGGMYNDSSYASVTNCILWNNLPALPAQIQGNATVTYSDIENGWPGDGNIDVDPLFVDPDNADFRLSPGSPCIDAGKNAAVPAGITTDLKGLPRFLDDPDTVDTGSGTPPIVDMGTNEFFEDGAPLADAGGPYTVNQNQSLVLDASASKPGDDDADYGDVIVLNEWDLDSDGAFDDHITEDAVSAVPWSTITSLSKAMGDLTIAVRVTDVYGQKDTAVTTLAVTVSVWNAVTVDSDDSVGAFTSLALDSSGNPSISYFDETNSDLKYAVWSGTSWDTQTIDSVGDVGRWSSLALDSSGNPRISYFDKTNDDLKYAVWNDVSSAWDIEIVDGDDNVGTHTSLSLDSSGNPRISYRDKTHGNLKYAAWNGTSWDIETVDDNGNVGYATSLVLDSSGNPHISYRDNTNDNLKYAVWNGINWDIETVDDNGDVGYNASLALDGADNPAISYFDDTDDDLKYAAWNGSNWDIETVDSIGDVGRWTSIAMDSANNPRISYHDNTNGDLKYAAFNGVYWTIRIIDSDGDVGDYTFLAMDSNDNPRISYYDLTNGDLKLAVTCVPAPGDWNEDCRVNLLDFTELAERWLECSVPFNPDCL